MTRGSVFDMLKRPAHGDARVAIVEHASFALFCGTISCYEKEEEAKHGAELNRHQGCTRA